MSRSLVRDGALTIKCRKDGFAGGTMVVQSTTKPMAFGNILFGGVIGTGVDMSTGAAYDYPQMIAVPMQTLPAATTTPPAIAAAPAAPATPPTS
jgi:hypothetical protein